MDSVGGSSQFNNLLGTQQSQTQDAMNYQAQSSQMNIEFQMFTAAINRQDSLAEAVSNLSNSESRKLES